MTISLLRTPLWKHQDEAVRFAEHRVGTMLDCEMGVGKTLMALALAQRWNARRVIVASPLSVIGSWERQVREHSSWPWQILRLDKGSVAKKAALVEQALLREPERLMIVVNHESIWRDPLGTLLLSHLWDVVIIDESHRAKAPNGKFSKFLRSLRDRSARRLGLTGTPLPHSLLDAFAQYRFLDPSIFGPLYTPFRLRYAQFDPVFPSKVVRWMNTGDFKDRFRRIAFHVTKAEALDLPPEVDEERSIVFEPEAKKLYAGLERDFFAKVGDGEVTASNALVKLLRLQQVTSGLIKLDNSLMRPVSNAKERLLHEAIEDLGTTGLPVVVFGRFTSDLQSVARVAASLDLRYAEISGHRKDGLSDGGQMLAGVDVLGVQIQAGGVGIDLSRSSVAIFFSLGFSLGDYLQARSRLHRPGQQADRVTFLHLLVQNTIDETVLAALRRREDVINAILREAKN